jgi:hypothetical protein
MTPELVLIPGWATGLVHLSPGVWAKPEPVKNTAAGLLTFTGIICPLLCSDLAASPHYNWAADCPPECPRGLLRVCPLFQFQPPAGVGEVLIWTDRDRSDAGQEAAAALAARLRTAGLAVRILLPPGLIPTNAKGVDWLDVLCAGRVDVIRTAVRSDPTAQPAAGPSVRGCSPPPAASQD